MELNELKSTWQILEKALERGNQLSVAMLRQQKLDAAQQKSQAAQAKPGISDFRGGAFYYSGRRFSGAQSLPRFRLFWEELSYRPMESAA